MKIKLLYYAPFLLTVLIAICVGIPQTKSFVGRWLFISIFDFALSILVIVLTYFLYFLLMGKYFKKTVRYSFQAAFRTIGLLGIFLIFSVSIYKPIEDIVYFTNETKTELTKRSLTLFEERMKTKGKVDSVYQISRMKGWADVEVSVFEKVRALEIDIMPINKNDNRIENFYYVYKDGKWVLDRTISQIY
ncbi:hypothetical protein ACFVR2_01785 [Gottfriedia sp. NPDC057991]|uniref:hypothetical protein n=1 Tax=Gottfriedia sp. NPDC057991 TaxID=3346298 RepID=UPI0036DBB7F0